MTPTPPPGRYDWLDFNAPMSGELADALAAVFARAAPARVVDIGCGWGELLLRVLAAAPDANGLGIDRDDDLLARGRANAAARGLSDRVAFRTDMPPRAELDATSAVICVGADHIFGTQTDALRALTAMLAPGGRLLFGTGFWERPPTVEEAAGVGASPGEFRSLADLVDLATSFGVRVLDLQTATRREWERFELGFLADWEEWLMNWPDDPGADDVRVKADQHRTGYLRGYREVLGFAYLTLGRPGTATR